MIKETILQHKAERDRLLAKKYIERENKETALKFLSSGLVKVVMGPRRAGKSVFSLLLLKGREFAYVNFDDEQLLKIKDYDEILKGIFEVYKSPAFILFDEIQNLANWELFVNKLQRRGYNLVITGSNSKLLSSELGSVLTGRYMPIAVLPLSFRECLAAKQMSSSNESLALPEAKGKLLNALAEYLATGGYPDIAANSLDAKPYLETLFDAVLFKDIVARHKVRFPTQLYNLALYLVSNFGLEFSFTGVRNSLGFRSTLTVQNYMSYLEESYIFFSLNRFDFKLKEQIRAPKKIFLVDNGFVTAKAFQLSSNTGRLMENAVFIELMRREYKPNEGLFYCKTKDKREVDFVLRKGIGIEALVQVCYDITNDKTKKREIDALISLSKEIKCDNLLVITYDYEAEEMHGSKKIQFIPLWKWLLE